MLVDPDFGVLCLPLDVRVPPSGMTPVPPHRDTGTAFAVVPISPQYAGATMDVQTWDLLICQYRRYPDFPVPRVHAWHSDAMLVGESVREAIGIEPAARAALQEGHPALSRSYPFWGRDTWAVHPHMARLLIYPTHLVWQFWRNQMDLGHFLTVPLELPWLYGAMAAVLTQEGRMT